MAYGIWFFSLSRFPYHCLSMCIGSFILHLRSQVNHYESLILCWSPKGDIRSLCDEGALKTILLPDDTVFLSDAVANCMSGAVSFQWPDYARWGHRRREPSGRFCILANKHGPSKQSCTTHDGSVTYRSYRSTTLLLFFSSLIITNNTHTSCPRARDVSSTYVDRWLSPWWVECYHSTWSSDRTWSTHRSSVNPSNANIILRFG